MTRIKSDFLSVLSAAKFLLSDLRGLRSDCLPLAVASTIDIEKTILAAYINRLFGSRVFVLSVPNNAAPGDESRVSINDSHLRINHLKRIRGDASRFNSLYFIGLSRQRCIPICIDCRLASAQTHGQSSNKQSEYASLHQVKTPFPDIDIAFSWDYFCHIKANPGRPVQIFVSFRRYFPTCLFVTCTLVERSNHDSPFEILKFLVTKPSFACSNQFYDCGRGSIRSNR